MGATKPTVQIDWINDDAASKYTIPDSAAQLAGHISGTNADPKIFNWAWWRVSQWIEFLDNTFDSNGNEVNAPKSTTITEAIAPAASTVTLDSGGIKSWDGSSNAIFSVTEAGAVTIGYSGNDIISLSGGAISVGTATSADLVKLHAITPSAADINPLLGASGNGLVVADITKLADIDASAAEIDILDGATLTTGELNILDGVTVTYDKINYLGASGLVAADLQKLADIDASAAEIDILDGATLSTAELNLLDGCTCTTGELNILDGVTANYTEINRLDSTSGLYITTGNTSTSGVYINDTTATYTALMINDSGGHGLQIVNTATNYNGIQIDDCGGHAIEINSAYDGTNTDAIHIDCSDVADYCRNGVYIKGTTTNGLYITDPGMHGIYVTDSGTSSHDSVYIADSQRYGVHVVDSDSHAFYVSGTATAAAGLCVNNCGGNAVDINGANNNGIHISSVTENGISLYSMGQHGIYIYDSGSSSHDAIFIADSQRTGLEIYDSDYHCIHLTNWNQTGIYIEIPTLNTTRGQLCFAATATAMATKYAGATGGEVGMFNNGGTIEFWFHNGTAWTKIA